MSAALAPATPAEAAEALAGLTARGEPVDVRGGGTRSARGWPGPVAGRELLTGGLRRVVAHEPADLTLTVEAGAPVADVAALLAAAGQCWPQADARPGSTVGGVLAAAASGRSRLRDGAVRDSVLEVVLATGDGRLVTAGGRTVKGVSGFDIPRLAVGSLGTLGVIVQVTLKLWPLPPARGWFAAEGALADRVVVGEAALAGPPRPGAVILTPGRLHVELTGPPEDVRPPAGLGPSGAPPAPAGAGVVEAGVPPPAVADLARRLEAAGLPYEARMGVGTCLVAVGAAEEVGRVRAWAAELGGHAVVADAPEELRADPWGPPPPGLAIMRRLRAAFDPAGILNRRFLPWSA
ncbi:FAD-binding protein [Miltoncostaea marina]|uniref:FAD-binding protein n=1 Tax=Miltoncostaea marina TaxID=2843215 RepID=UPI001C3D0749|nr:FAD-binding protein [Miltoncostaea marina]